MAKELLVFQVLLHCNHEKTIYSYINVRSLKTAPKNTINLSVVQVFLHKNTNVHCLFAISGL